LFFSLCIPSKLRDGGELTVKRNKLKKKEERDIKNCDLWKIICDLHLPLKG
jgi:hypothetical protein